MDKLKFITKIFTNRKDFFTVVFKKSLKLPLILYFVSLLPLYYFSHKTSAILGSNLWNILINWLVGTVGVLIIAPWWFNLRLTLSHVDCAFVEARKIWLYNALLESLIYFIILTICIIISYDGNNPYFRFFVWTPIKIFSIYNAYKSILDLYLENKRFIKLQVYFLYIPIIFILLANNPF